MLSVTAILHPFERSDIALVLRMPGSRENEHHLTSSVTASDGKAGWHKEAGDFHATVYREVGFNGVRS